jgi:two-component system, chemotaxis family, CheB/CheR fusion protein
LRQSFEDGTWVTVLSDEQSEFMSADPSSLRILIADDDRDGVLTLELLLRQEGHDVRSVHSGREVMKAVRDFNPEVVLLDIAMPLLSGWELARMIREQFGRRVMLIGISGKYNHSADNILSDSVGFDHYVLKPYDPQALIALITLIARQHLQSARVPTSAL